MTKFLRTDDSTRRVDGLNRINEGRIIKMEINRKMFEVKHFSSKAHDVIITNCRSPATLSIIRSLKDRQMNIIAGDNMRFSISFYSRYVKKKFVYPNPLKNVKGCIECLIKQARQSKSPVLFPAGDDIILLATANRELIENYFIFPLPCNESLIKTLDKKLTVDLADKLNIPTPRTYQITSMKELLRIESTAYPIVLKPRISAGFRETFGKKIMVAHNTSEMVYFWKKINNKFPLLLQEFIPGYSDKIYSVATIYDRSNNSVATFQIRKLVEMMPGITACAEQTHCSFIEEYSHKILKYLNWIGPAEVEFKWDYRDNLPKLLEINPRPFYWMEFLKAAGFDMPNIWYDIAVNNKVVRPKLMDATALFVNLTSTAIGMFNSISSQSNLISLLRRLRNLHKRKIRFAILDGDDIVPFLVYPLLLLQNQFEEKLKRH